jgi:hypothetical protein
MHQTTIRLTTWGLAITYCRRRDYDTISAWVTRPRGGTNPVAS